MNVHRTLLLAVVAGLLSTGSTCSWVNITQPQPGSVLTSAQTMTISVVIDAILDPSVIESVDFRDGSATVCTDDSAPFQCDWSVTSADNGGHVWTALVHLTTGSSLSSLPVAMSVAIQDSPPMGQPELVGFLPGLGSVMDVAVSGAEAFVASEHFGLSVSDVSSPGSVHVMGTSDEPFLGDHAAVGGSRAVVAGERNGMAHLWVLDRSNPAAPVVVGELATTVQAGPSTAFQDVSMNPSGTLAVVAHGVAGLLVVDLSNPTAPSVVGSYNTTGIAYGVDLQGSTAYVADGLGGLAVISVANPTAPTLLGTKSLTGVMRDVAVSGSIAYVANQQGGLKIVDVSSPTAPRQIGFASSAGFAFHVAAEGTRVVILSDNGQSTWLDLLDVSDPMRPSLLGTTSVGPVGAAKGVDLAGGLAYVATGVEGLKIYATGAGAPSLQSISADTFVARAVADSGQVAVVVGEHKPTSTALLQVLDISAPGDLAVVGELFSSDPVGPVTGFQDVALDASGTLAVVARGVAGVSVVDLSNPAAPRILGTYDTSGTAYAVALQGSLVYVADGLGDLAVLSIANPAQPSLVATKSLTGIMRDVAVSGGVAYLANQQGGLKVVDVSDPAAPRLIGAQGTSGFGFHVALQGTRAAVLSDDGSATILDLMDVSDPARPKLLASVPVGPVGVAHGLDVSGTHAFVATGSEGLQIYDITDLAAPSLHGAVAGIGEVYGVAVGAGSACVADSISTIAIVGLQ